MSPYVDAPFVGSNDRKNLKSAGGRYFYKGNKCYVTQPSLVVSLKTALDFTERGPNGNQNRKNLGD